MLCNVLLLIIFTYEFVTSIIMCVENICRTHNFQEIVACITHSNCIIRLNVRSYTGVNARLRNTF